MNILETQRVVLMKCLSKSKTHTIAFALTAVCSIIGFLPLVLGLHLHQETKFKISLAADDSFVALVGSIAVSIPMALDMAMDVLTYTLNPSYLYEKGWLPRMLLILSLMVPDIFMLAIAIPNEDPTLVIALYFIRNNFFIYAVYTLLLDLHVFHHPKASAMVFVCFSLSNTFSTFSYYEIGSYAIHMLAYAFNGVGCFALIFLSVSLWWKIHKEPIKTLTRTELTSNFTILALDLYALVLVAVFMTHDTIEAQLPLVTYAEGVFTVAIWLQQHRLLMREVHNKNDELEFKRMFVRYISHEVRTPLNTALMGLQVLIEELSLSTHTSNKENFQIVVDIKTSTEIAINVLNELLAFDKLESGTLILEKTELNVVELVEKTLQPFYIQSKRAQVSLSLEMNPQNFVSSQNSYFIHVDENKIAQVIRNLVSNGLKFTPKNGKVTVFLDIVNRTEILMSNNEIKLDKMKQLQISVVDTGPGISEENQAKLFKSIIQFHPGKLQKGGGSGIGLYISHGITKLHGGSLSVCSKGEGYGCTFTLHLPLIEITSSPKRKRSYHLPSLQSPLASSRSESRFIRMLSKRRNSVACINSPTDLDREETDRIPQRDGNTSQTSHNKLALKSREKNEPSMSGLKDFLPDEIVMIDSSNNNEILLNKYHLRILVVDDTALSRKMQCRLLKKRCECCIEAEDGQQAVDIIRENMKHVEEGSTIDLILMDSVMPVLTGNEAVRQIRNLGYEGMIFGVTGNVAQDDVDAFIASGADVVLPKPFDIDRFDYAVNNLINPKT